jgi:hypothetical protein
VECKEWLLLGGLRDDDELCSQLALPGYHINSTGKLVIESKKSLQDRGEKSPDDADAFNLTFARRVAVAQKKEWQEPPPHIGLWS